MGTLVTLLVYLVVIALIWWVITYALENLPLPAPVQQFGKVIATVIIVIVVVYAMLQLIGGGSLSLPK